MSAQECRSYFDKSFEVRAYSGYGLSGAITRKDGNQAPIDLVTVPYCSVFPNGSMGLGGMRQVWQGIEIVNEWVTTGPQGGADLNVPILMGAQVPCPGDSEQLLKNGQRRRRRLGRQDAPQAPDGGPPARHSPRRDESSSFRRGNRDSASRPSWPGHRPATVARAPTSRLELQQQSSGAISRLGDQGPPAQAMEERRAGTELGLLLVNVSGPSSSLGGPGYDAGLFWAEVNIELAGVGTAALLENTTVWYSVDGGQPLNCSGAGGDLYAGPILISSAGGGGVVRAVACVRGTPVAAGHSEPFSLVMGPYASITISFGDGAEAAAVKSYAGAQVVRTLCAALAITNFCAERVVVDAEDAAGGMLTAHILSATNAEAGSWRRQLVLNPAALQHHWPAGGPPPGPGWNLTVTDVSVTVPVPRERLHHPWQYCTSHYDCAAVDPTRIGTNITNTTPSDLPWGTGFCAARSSRLSAGRAPTCAYCQLHCMIESTDSFDGICPEHCGNFFSGKLPQCMSSGKLQETYSCNDQYRFELRQFTQDGERVPDPRRAKMNTLRSLTPSNNLIGGVILTQYRSPDAACPISSTGGMGRFESLHGVQCVDSAAVDPRPFGADPSFVVSSALFDGKHTPQQFYNLSTEAFTTDQAGAPTVMPYGFFPHQWDSVRRAPKNASLIWPASVDEFKLYFDGRISSEQAQTLLQYMEDGRFFDVATSQLKVEMIAYNAELKLFATWTVVFDWQRTGDISWDYALQIVDVEGRETSLTGPALALLLYHFAMEVWQIYVHCRSMRLGEYVWSLFNLISWLNILVQGVAWYYWLEIRAAVAAFEMDESSYVLADPLATFRPFATDAEQEYRLLELIDRVSMLGDLQGYHSSFAGISIILFVFNMIARLDFQPQMGLITRTLSRAGSHLAHYIVLYVLVFMGYAVVGNLMFGSLYAGMATLSMTCQTLMFMMLAFDPTHFYAQMNHAITHRQGSSVQPGSTEYNIYLWSYMFINAFILMNIFLAILVSAYDDIARESHGCKGVLADIHEMLTYNARRLFLPATHFITDDDLLQQIGAELRRLAGGSWGETELSARAHTVRDALAPKQAILLGRGVAMEKEQIKALVEKVIQSKAPAGGRMEKFKTRLADFVWPSLLPDDPPAAANPETPAGSVIEDGCATPEGRGAKARRRSLSQSQVNLLLSEKYAAVDELMARLGVDMRKRSKEAAEEVFRLLQIEGHASLIRVLSAVEGLEERMGRSGRRLGQMARHLMPGTHCAEELAAEEEQEEQEAVEVAEAEAAAAVDPATVIGTLEVTSLTHAPFHTSCLSHYPPAHPSPSVFLRHTLFRILSTSVILYDSTLMQTPSLLPFLILSHLVSEFV